ncbi:FtsK/SpoIIIE domain-containing protein, partial [Intestinibacter bartlettii]
DKFYVLIGEDLLGNIKMIDLNDSNSPHLLIAGQTGSGKSVLLNSMLVSIMFMYEPDDIEMILIDPKQVELTVFEDSPFTKNNYIFTEPEEAIKVLDSLVEEMDERYKLFRKSRVKNIASYNEKFPDNKQKRILLVFDEFGAMIEDSKEVKDKLEYSIKKLAQKARAAGIHMIISTQTPRADIITTTIRNNLTARIALKVTDSNASSLILDSKGAESLLGKGDMLIKTAESSTFVRTKSPYIDEDEIYDIINYLNSGVEQ